jgi:two-component sensor histidine kinase
MVVFGLPLDHGLTAPATVRAALRQRMPEAASAPLLLVASELVANAVLHGVPPLSVTVSVFADRVLIEVADGSAEMGVPGDGSRGLMIVGEITNAWGVECVPGGKVVWAEIGLDQL